MDNNLLLWIIIAFAAYYMFFMNSEENFQEQDQLKSNIAKQIIAFINKDTTHTEYLNMLSTTDNPSYELLKPETFYEFKKIATDSKLVENDIIKYMKDV